MTPITPPLHLRFDVARIMDDIGLGQLPGQRTIKTECGKRVRIEQTTSDIERPRLCSDCRIALVASAQRELVSLRMLPADLRSADEIDHAERHFKRIVERG